MSRKPKKKKPIYDLDGEPIKEDLLFYFDNVPDVTIYGHKFKRIPYDGVFGKTCPDCHVGFKKLHKVACGRECCPYCKGVSWLCLCDPDVTNAERDGYVECILEEGTIDTD